MEMKMYKIFGCLILIATVIECEEIRLTLKNETPRCLQVRIVSKKPPHSRALPSPPIIENYWIGSKANKNEFNDLVLFLYADEVYKYSSISAIYCQNISDDLIDALNAGESQQFPKILGKWSRFNMPDQEYVKLLYNNQLPDILITADTINKKPVINMPPDVKSLKEAITKEVKQKVKEALPQMPRGKDEEGGVPAIIAEYVVN